MLNLFAFRTTNPKLLRQVADPIGELNNYFIQLECDARPVICMWGTKGNYMNRDRYVLNILKSKELYCLGKTKAGYPKHPLYLKADTRLVKFEGVVE